MSSLQCYASCGFTQLCIIACPNNRVLEENAVLLCSFLSELPDDGEPLRIEFAADATAQRRSDEEPEIK